MSSILTRIVLVPAVAIAAFMAIATATPAAAAPAPSTTTAVSTLDRGGSDDWDDWDQWDGGNVGLLPALLASLLGGQNQCGLVNLLLGGCQFNTFQGGWRG